MVSVISAHGTEGQIDTASLLKAVGISNHRKPSMIRALLPETYRRYYLSHPAFWPSFEHKEGDYGLHFKWTGSVIPWELQPLNVTEASHGHAFDYTYLNTEDPSEFWYFSWEKYDWKDWGTWGTINWHCPIVAGTIYLITIFGLDKWMRHRPALKLKWPLFFWNVVLGLFSIMGFIRTSPEFFHKLFDDDGFFKSICYR